MAQPVKSRFLRGIYLTLGFFFLGVGFIGILVPLIPTTGPVILAAFFFALSSPRFDRWLVNHRLFGPVVRDWRAGAGFTVRAKTIAVLAIAATFTVTIVFAIDSAALRIFLILLAIGIATFIVTRPTKQARTEASTGPIG